MAEPATATDLVGEPRHPSQHLVDVGDHVLAVDLDHGVRGARSGDVKHRAILGDVDPLAGEHRVAVALHPGLVTEVEQQVHRLGVHQLLGVVEGDAEGLGGEPTGSPCVAGEQLAEGGPGHRAVLPGQRLPGGQAIGGGSLAEVRNAGDLAGACFGSRGRRMVRGTGRA